MKKTISESTKDERCLFSHLFLSPQLIALISRHQRMRFWISGYANMRAVVGPAFPALCDCVWTLWKAWAGKSQASVWRASLMSDERWTTVKGQTMAVRHVCICQLGSNWIRKTVTVWKWRRTRMSGRTLFHRISAVSLNTQLCQSTIDQSLYFNWCIRNSIQGDRFQQLCSLWCLYIVVCCCKVSCDNSDLINHSPAAAADLTI